MTMSTSKSRQQYYEAMFLISQSSAADLAGAVEHIRGIIARADAPLIAMRKWDERRMAYEINKQKRGTYILAYFEADPQKMPHIERDCNLSEIVMRVLMIRADHLTLEEMQAADDQRGLETEAALRKARAAESAAASPASSVSSSSASPAPAPADEPEPAEA
jgi:small subunit ribosomal protein S6